MSLVLVVERLYSVLGVRGDEIAVCDISCSSIVQQMLKLRPVQFRTASYRSKNDVFCRTFQNVSVNRSCT